ncbi:tyrosine-type recombinase/integrase [Sphingomonas sp. HMP9]|uniref:tyrosine-type recombinase/integrase n=1 Tax=Sphingomonas sp. HMP9 TaxID=1517554 RepID=UPI001596E801|nr:site-specific integrase [Sphingomonas sp. HMP9]
MDVLFPWLAADFHSAACQMIARTKPLPTPQTAETQVDKTVTINKRFINEITFPSTEDGRRVHWDKQLKGYGIRVNPNRTIVFVVQYRMKAKGAKTQTYTIGKYGSPWSPDAAREEARSLLEQVHRGIDPIAQRRTVEAAAEQAALEEVHYEFNAFADRYIEEHVKANDLRSLSDIQGTFDRDIRPFFQGKSVRQITKQDCKDLRSQIGQRSKSAANKAHKWLNAALMWGIEHDGLESSPMLGLKRPYKEGKRNRTLSEWEIALLWSVLPQLAWQFAMHMRILILTGLRLREVSGMTWEEIDLDRKEWIVPGARTKNKRDHLVPILPVFERLLTTIEPDPQLRSGLLLTTNGRTPVSGFSKSKAEVDVLIDSALRESAWRTHGPFAPWVRHDMRRTLSTMCGEMRVPIAYAEAILNHVSGTLDGVAGTYWLYQYAREKRETLAKWEKRLEKIMKKHKVAFP